jgi:hypothetical protein
LSLLGGGVLVACADGDGEGDSGAGRVEATTPSTASSSTPAPASSTPTGAGGGTSPTATVPGSASTSTSVVAGGTSTSTVPGGGPTGIAGMGPFTNSPDPAQPWRGQTGDYSPLRAVRTARHDGFDRLVFEFAGPVPGYLVGYGPPSLSATDDTPVTVAGGAGLAVTLFGGGSWMVPDPYDGPTVVRGDTVVVTEARQVDDFEAVNRWLVGVDRQRPFSVETLSDPSRIVIDVRDEG